MSTPVSDEDLMVIHRQVYSTFNKLGNAIGPTRFQTFLCGMLGNLAGNMSPEFWNKMRVTEPCGNPGCNCHVYAEEVMTALERLREDHIRTTNQ